MEGLRSEEWWRRLSLAWYVVVWCGALVREVMGVGGVHTNCSLTLLVRLSRVFIYFITKPSQAASSQPDWI